MLFWLAKTRTLDLCYKGMTIHTVYSCLTKIDARRISMKKGRSSMHACIDSNTYFCLGVVTALFAFFNPVDFY